MLQNNFAHKVTPLLRVNLNVLYQDVFTKDKAVHAFDIAFNGLDGEFYHGGSERITDENYASEFILSIVDMSKQNALNLQSDGYDDENKTDIVTIFS
ncbi:MAG: hypothetical protein ACFCUL_11655 [Flavobacteriaceae bacterium]